MGSMSTESENVMNLKGTAANPANDPKISSKAGNKGSTGDKALMDAVILIGACWLLLVILVISLRNHNN